MKRGRNLQFIMKWAFCHRLPIVTSFSFYIQESWGASGYFKVDLWIITEKTTSIVSAVICLEAGHPWAEFVWTRNMRLLRSLKYRVDDLVWFTVLICHLHITNIIYKSHLSVIASPAMTVLCRNAASSTQTSNLS